MLNYQVNKMIVYHENSTSWCWPAHGTLGPNVQFGKFDEVASHQFRLNRVFTPNR